MAKWYERAGKGALGGAAFIGGPVGGAIGSGLSVISPDFYNKSGDVLGDLGRDIPGIGTAFGLKSSADIAAGKQLNASRAAQSAQEQANLEAAKMQQPIIDETRQAWDELLKGVYGNEFNVGQIDLSQDPGYQFRMNEGNQALQSLQAARGGLGGTGAEMQATRYGQNLASQEYQNAYDRQNSALQNRYNMLAGLAQQYTGGLANQANLRLGLGATQAGAIENRGNIEAASRLANGQRNAQFINAGLQFAGNMMAPGAGGSVASAVGPQVPQQSAGTIASARQYMNQPSTGSNYYTQYPNFGSNPSGPDPMQAGNYNNYYVNGLR
jgi:hypothetical protein